MYGTEQIVDAYLLARRGFHAAGQGHTLTGWRASSLGYCPRRQMYERLGLEKPEVDARVLRTFAYGDMIHDWIKGIYRRTGLLLAEEGSLEWPERSLRGHYDVLLAGTPAPVEEIPEEIRADWSPEWIAWLGQMREEMRAALGPDEAVVLGEIKSMHSRAIKYAYEQGPQKAHTYQVGAYWLMLQQDPTQVPAVPTTARLIYVGKDSGGILEFGIQSEWVERAYERLLLLNGAWDAWDLPPCICGDEGELPRKYCGYYNEQAKTCCDPGLMPERGDAR